MTRFKNHPLTEAARYGDAKAEEMGIPALALEIGLDPEALMYVANQRALRITLITHRGGEALKQAMGKSVVDLELSVAEMTTMTNTMLAELDGIALGWRARQIAERSESGEA